MNTLSFIVTFVIPGVVVGYCIFFLSKFAKVPTAVEISYDKNIDKIDFDRRPNEGDRLSEEEIFEKTRNLLEKYKEILK